MPKTKALVLRPFDSSDRPPLLQACKAARMALRDMVDLLLIHNETKVSGKQPRATLNPLVVLLSVASWERLLTDLEHIQRTHGYAGPGIEPSVSGGSYLGGAQSTARSILDAATDGMLPSRWRIRVSNGATGRRLHSFTHFDGSDPELHDTIDGYIRMRNGVAHLVTPQIARNHPEGWLSTDTLLGDTVNTSTARMVAATMLQVIDQTVLHVLTVAQADERQITTCRPPKYYLRDDASFSDGSRTFSPGCLWGGAALNCP